jgi:hypothetical protein
MFFRKSRSMGHKNNLQMLKRTDDTFHWQLHWIVNFAYSNTSRLLVALYAFELSQKSQGLMICVLDTRYVSFSSTAEL